jgi:hypothetical protein
MERAAEGFAELFVRDELGCGEVQGTSHVPSLQGEDEGADGVFFVHPREHLTSVSERSADHGLEGAGHHGERSAAFSEHYTKAQARGADAKGFGLADCLLPIHTHFGQKVLSGRIVLFAGLMGLPWAVVANT